jgi:hypothetical protein
MPCDTRISQQVARQRAAAKKELENEIAQGKRQIVKDPVTGEVGITDWEQSTAAQVGWCDGCILRAMQSSADWAVQSQLAAAGVQQNQQFVSVGHNSHGH